MKQGRRSNEPRRYSLTIAAALSVSFFGATSAVMAEELPTAWTVNVLPLDSVAEKAMPALDLHAIALEDIANQTKELPSRFAIPNPSHITPDTDGTWEKINATTLLWRLRVTCPNALSINFGFTRYTMPAGGQLYLYSKDQTSYIRPFTADDNREYNQLWTPPVMSNDVIIELTIPESKRRSLDLELGSINLGYYGFGAETKALGDEGGIASGSCNVDVVCPEGLPWANEIPSVGNLLMGGSFFCTGFLVNNTAQDRKPYLITANHCGVSSGNAASLVVYWNYYNSTCRPVGSPASGGAGNGSFSTFSTGSTWRAGSSTQSDFTLVELSAQPSPAWNLSWAGWDRSGNQSPSGACIHHPSNDEKRISFYSITTDSSTCGFAGLHVHAIWSLGVTEGGSSGSPLFNNNHRVIGQLHGGPSICGGLDLSDCYGRFSSSWTGGSTNSTRLSNWLDPLNTGQVTLDTLGPVPPPPSNDGCSGALLVATGSTAFNTATATTEGFSERNCSFAGGTQIDKDIWFKWLPTCTGTATISVCGSTFDTRLGVYLGCPAGAGATLACNDNFCGTSSQVSLHVIQNQLHRIRVGGFGNATGTGSVTISCVPDPPSCPGDVNNSGSINIDDLVIIITNWGAAGGVADINHDNIVNIDDLVLVITAWGSC